MARDSEVSHGFACHPQLECAFTSQRHSITAHSPVLISLPAESRRLSWPG